MILFWKLFWRMFLANLQILGCVSCALERSMLRIHCSCIRLFFLEQNPHWSDLWKLPSRKGLLKSGFYIVTHSKNYKIEYKAPSSNQKTCDYSLDLSEKATEWLGRDSCRSNKSWSIVLTKRKRKHLEQATSCQVTLTNLWPNSIGDVGIPLKASIKVLSLPKNRTSRRSSVVSSEWRPRYWEEGKRSIHEALV